MSALTWLLVLALENRYSIWLTAGDPGTPVTVIWAPSCSCGPRSPPSTTWSGCVGQWPEVSVRSSTGPPGDARPTTVSCVWKVQPPGQPGSPGFGVTGMFAVTVVSGNGPAAALTPGRCAVPASWAVAAWAVAVTSEPCWAANA